MIENCRRAGRLLCDPSGVSSTEMSDSTEDSESFERKLISTYVRCWSSSDASHALLSIIVSTVWTRELLDLVDDVELLSLTSVMMLRL